MTGGGNSEPDALGAYAPDLRCEADLSKRTENQSGYCSPEMDALLLRLDAELDNAKRRDILKQIIARVNDDLPYVTIGFVPRFFMMRDHVKGFTSDGEGSFTGLYTTWLDR
jgi:peptide/nickel transport system substrate-binding protein